VYWRDVSLLKKAVMDDREEHVSMHFDHGMDVNMQFIVKREGEIKQIL
jgi:hypothetical protein